MNVTCPDGATAGSKVPVQTPDGRLFQVEVPQGVQPGQVFTIQVPSPAGTTTAATPTPANVTAAQQPTVTHVVHHHSTWSYYNDTDDLDRAGQVNACCLIMLAVATLCMSISLSQTVAWHFTYEDGDCWYDWVCCNAFCSRWCYYTTCETQWRVTRPISQDKLPEPDLAPDSNSTNVVYNKEPGDGYLDYWSLPIGVTLGSIGAVIVMFVACAPACRYSRCPAKGIVCAMIFAFVCHLTSCICLGIQFFPTYGFEKVYNYFRIPQYENLRDESLIHYLMNDKYYNTFGNCVLACWIFTCILAIYELVFTVCIFKADERVTRPRRSRSTNTNAATAREHQDKL